MPHAVRRRRGAGGGAASYARPVILHPTLHRAVRLCRGGFVPAPRRRRGFTLLELMIVVAVIAILALIAVPGIPDRVIREQVIDGVRLTDFVKAGVQDVWAKQARLPIDNADAGVPVADKIVSNVVSSVAVESGALQITFGNQANANLRGKVLTLRPGVVDDAPVVPIAWVCGNAEAPARMTARGLNKTSVPTRYLPLNCRAPAKAGSVG